MILLYENDSKDVFLYGLIALTIYQGAANIRIEIVWD